MRFDSVREFGRELDRAGRDYLATRGVACSPTYRLTCEECQVHGPGCARVTYGVFRDHIPWRWTDPAAAAAGMLRTMLPPAIESGATVGQHVVPPIARAPE